MNNPWSPENHGPKPDWLLFLLLEDEARPWQIDHWGCGLCSHSTYTGSGLLLVIVPILRNPAIAYHQQDALGVTVMIFPFVHKTGWMENSIDPSLQMWSPSLTTERIPSWCPDPERAREQVTLNCWSMCRQREQGQLSSPWTSKVTWVTLEKQRV